jgi:hypothetical protein
MHPTHADTVSVAVSFVLATASATITPTEEAHLEVAVADSMALDPSDIENFAVTITAARRLAAAAAHTVAGADSALGGESISASKNLRRLSGYVWTVSFDVVLELSATAAASPSALASTLAADLTANLATELSAQGIAATVDASSIATVTASRHPTRQPSRMPQAAKANAAEPMPGETQKKKSSASSASSGPLIGAAVGVVVVLGLGGAFLLRKQGPKDDDDFDADAEEMAKIGAKIQGHRASKMMDPSGSGGGSSKQQQAVELVAMKENPMARRTTTEYADKGTFM